jgi:signal transduction histidine kinase
MTALLRRALRPTLRLRVAVASTAGMAVILTMLSLFVYGRLHAELARALDSGLQARASAIASGLAQGRTALSDSPDAPAATITQVLTPGGRVLAQAGPAAPHLSARILGGLSAPRFIDIPARGRLPALRLYVLPTDEDGHLFVVTGTTLSSLNQTLSRLGLLLLVGGPTALVLAGLVSWIMAGAALGPVEHMRREAAAISDSAPSRRLPVPNTDDEIARLGQTLNVLLDRLQAGLDRERRLLDNASHELRTPLGTLKAELDLALSRARTPDELQAALQSASEETNRLSRLAQDMLVLSRARDGGLRIHRVGTALDELIERVCARHGARAAQIGARIECHMPGTQGSVDPMRLGQALDNLLDNAIRYSGRGGPIVVDAAVAADALVISVENSGPGFPPEILPRAFEPFVSGRLPVRPGSDLATGVAPEQPGAGLGLAIVQAVAQAHGGTASAENLPGGARVIMTLPLSQAGPNGFHRAFISGR